MTDELPKDSPSDPEAETLESQPEPTRGGMPREIGRYKVRDRKSTRLNSSHVVISYAVFCLKKKKNITHTHITLIMFRCI